jgi:hypothetical protein
MKPTLAILAAALTLLACAPTNVTPPPPRAGDPPKSSPVRAPPARPAPPQSRPAPPAQPTDTCGARDLQYLVGRPKTEIPVPVNPRNRRVTCTTCPVTMDFNAQRVNIFFDQATGIVKEVKCG